MLPSLSVARADGPGAGRFLALALSDALAGGQGQFFLRAPTSTGPRYLDFLFPVNGGNQREVIRVEVDRAGQVVSAELLRETGDSTAALFAAPPDLLDALHSGSAVAEIVWDPADSSAGVRSVTVIMRSDRSFHVSI